MNASTIKPFNIAINGFGRIGRNVLRAYIERFCQNPLQLQPLNIVAINDIAEPATLLHLLKYDIFRTLAFYNSGPCQDDEEISLRLSMIFAFGRACGRHVGGLHLCPLDLDAGEGHPGTFYAGRTLHSINLRSRIDEPLHQAEVAAGNGLGRPDLDY